MQKRTQKSIGYLTLVLLQGLAWAQDNAENVPEAGKPVSYYVIIGVLIVVGLFLLYWLSSVVRLLTLRAKHRNAPLDGQPSVDERLMSELAPMQVALLRGNIQGYYEKCRSTAVQIAASRGLIEHAAKNDSTDSIIKRLKSIGVDPVFMDCFESILQRCDEVLKGGEKPDDADHRKLNEDLHSLIRMRPKAPIRATEPGVVEPEPDEDEA